MTVEINNYWKNVGYSVHRENTEEYYKLNALEHVSLMSEHSILNPSIDLGSGQGKLLQFYAKFINCTAGLDISNEMINESRSLLGQDFNLIHADPFEYLPNSDYDTWITCGALNQYLNNDEITKLFEIFKNNKKVKSFYLFETICTIRYHLLQTEMSFRPPKVTQGFFKKFFKKIFFYFLKIKFSIFLLAGLLGRDNFYLGSAIMGYAHSPRYWYKLAKNFGFNIRIIGSQYYEYRYHVIITKDGY